MSIEIKKQYDLVHYETSVKFMQIRVNQIFNKSKNELIWFLNHDHIYTQGTSAKTNEILKKNKIRIVKTNRGGKTTYHGPGQRIVYFMIDLNNKKKDIRKFITIIEKSLMDF
jgi:Lipoate-protein ligase B